MSKRRGKANVASAASKFEEKVAENRAYVLAHCDLGGPNRVCLIDVVQNV